MRCSCGGFISWDDQSGQVCTKCATVVDSSPVQFVSQYDSETSFLHPGQQSFTFKPLRASYHQTAEESKEARIRRNTLAMHQYIGDLARNLQIPSLSSRTQNIFDNAMASGTFRWGRRAKLIAGAALSIAMRESKRPESLQDIATLLEEDTTQLQRAFLAIIAALKISATPSDAHAHITALKSRIEMTLRPETKLFPAHAAILKSIDLNNVLQTGRSLIDLLSRTPSDVPPAPTAAATFLFSVEAESRAVLPKLNELCGFVAQHCNIGKETVVRRYQTLEHTFMCWMEGLPWYNNSRVAKRLVLARGLKDMISWKDTTWKKSLAENRPALPSIAEDDHTDAQYELTIGQKRSAALMSAQSESTTQPAPAKKRRRRHPLINAKHFLVDPKNAPLPALPAPDANRPYPSFHDANIELPLTTFILAGPSDPAELKHMPTRLELLAVARGGSSTEKIPDTELFDDGEFEGMLRNEEEKALFLHLWKLDGGDEVLAKKLSQPPRRKAPKAGGCGRSKRIDAQALASFLSQDHGDHSDEFTDLLTIDDEKEDGDENIALLGLQHFKQDDEDDENEYELWHEDDRYEQET